METNIKEDGLIMLNKEEEPTNIKTEMFMKVILKQVRNKDKVFLDGILENVMKDSGLRI